MTQNTYGPINPQTTDGLALATELDQFWENFRSGNSGPAAPPYIEAGGLWFELPPTGPRRLMLRNSGADIPILEVNSGVAKLAPGIAAIEPGTIMMWYGSHGTIPVGLGLLQWRDIPARGRGRKHPVAKPAGAIHRRKRRRQPSRRRGRRGRKRCAQD